METGTLKELNVKPGDVVGFKDRPELDGKHKIKDRINDCSLWGDAGWTTADGGILLDTDHSAYIISRASDAPKTWGEMTDAEKGAVPQHVLDDPTNPLGIPWGEWSRAAKGAALLAEHEGEMVDAQRPDGSWTTARTLDDARDSWIVRVRPEPVRETVTLYGYQHEDGWWIFLREAFPGGDTHRITFTTENGNPDCTKCPTCGTARHVDMEAL